jgi:hypothetical protein
VARQYSPKARAFEPPKNGLTRQIVLTPPAREGLLALPRPMDADALVFRASKGGPMTGRVQHYYWHPVRCRFGNPSMDLYELRHFCASWLLNDLGLPPQDVAHQLGHTDGGALVQKLYGHPPEKAGSGADQARCRRQRSARCRYLGGRRRDESALRGRLSRRRNQSAPYQAIDSRANRVSVDRR